MVFYLLISIIFLITSLKATESTPSVHLKCFFYNPIKSSTFNFNSFTKSQDTILSSPTSTSVFYYNWCKNVQSDHNCPSPPHSKYFNRQSSFIKKVGDTCIRLAGSIEPEYDNKSNWLFYHQEGQEESGIKISFTHGDKCTSDPITNKEIYYQLIYDIQCDSHVDDIIIDYAPLFIEVEGEMPICLYTLKGKSKAACPIINTYSINLFISEYKLSIGLILIPLGVYLSFLFNCNKAIALIMIITFDCIIIPYIILLLISIQTTTILNSFLISSSLFTGILIGFLTKKYLPQYINQIPLTFGGGYVLGVLFYNIFLRYIETNPIIIYWTTIAFGIIIHGLLNKFYFEEVSLNYCSIMIGSYLLMRSMTIIIGDFPSEWLISDLVKYEEWELLKKYQNGLNYIYLAVCIAIYLFGAALNISWRIRQWDRLLPGFIVMNEEQVQIQH